MAVRNESVRFQAIDDFTGPTARMAAALALVNRELHSLSGQSTRTSRASTRMSSDLDSVARSAGKADESINQLTGRLRLFADLAAILGPSLVPIGAVAVPAVAGLANELGVAALAAGTAIVAFQGVGDALKAVNEAALEPTQDNLEEARQAMADLSPAAQALVVQLDAMRPALAGLRDSAATGLFPGLIDGIDALESRLPDVDRILTNISDTLGGLLAEGGASLASDRWDEFFDFLATDATTTLSDLGRTVGNLTHGLAELWMAFDPLNDDFSSWLLDVSEGFDSWAQGLSQTEGFKEFIAYIRENGPKVADAMGALGDAVLQILEAAAPLGGPTLQALEAVAEVIAAIADSNLGPVLLAFASLNSIAGRLGPVMQRTRAEVAGLPGAFERASTGIRQFRTDFATMSTTAMTAGARTQREMARTAEAATRMRSSLAAVGRGAAPIAGLTVAMSGLGQESEWSNAVLLGSAGLMAGPWVGAIGAGVGALLDLTQEEEKSKVAVEQLTATLDEQTGAFTDASRQWVAMRLSPELLAELEQLGINTSTVIDTILAGGPAVEQMFDQIARTDFGGTIGGLAQVNPQLNILRMRMLGLASDSDTAQENFHLVNDAAKGSSSGLAAMAAAAGNADLALGDFGATFDSMASASAGVSDALYEQIDAMRDLRSEALRNLDANLNYQSSLLDSRDAVKKYGAVLRGVGNVRKANTREEIAAVEALNAQAAGWNNLNNKAKNAPGAFKAARAALMQTAQNFGMTRDQAAAYVRKVLEIPPKRVTDIRLEGIATASAQVGGLIGQLDRLPRVRTVTIQTVRVGAALGTPSADGGSVPKTGLPYADRHPYLLADGEEVISNRYGQADRHRALLKAINAGRLADGGTAGLADGGTARAIRRFDVDPGDSRADARSEIRELRRALKHWSKAMDKQADKLVQVTGRYAKLDRQLERRTARADAYRRDVASSFDNDIFGNGLAGLELQLRADRNDARSMRQAIRKAENRGLSGGLARELFASGDLNTAQQVSRLSRGEIGDLESLYRQRVRQQNRLARFATSDQFGGSIDRLEKRMRKLDKTMDRLEGAVERGARRGVGDRDRKTSQRRKAGR